MKNLKKGFAPYRSRTFGRMPTSIHSRASTLDQSKTRGFTLIELLVVIAIIALLSSVVLASLSTARAKSRDARRIADLDQIKIALEMYFDDNGYYPASGGSYTANGYVCTSVNQWDCNGYRMSYLTADQPAGDTSWTRLETDLKPYIPKLPVDPINSSCPPYTKPGKCYSYLYGNVGRSHGRSAYDLAARLETPNHPQSCVKNNYTYGTGIYNTNTSNFLYGPEGQAWCPVYPDEMYDPSPN